MQRISALARLTDAERWPPLPAKVSSSQHLEALPCVASAACCLAAWPKVCAPGWTKLLWQRQQQASAASPRLQTLSVARCWFWIRGAPKKEHPVQPLSFHQPGALFPEACQQQSAVGLPLSLALPALPPLPRHGWTRWQVIRHSALDGDGESHQAADLHWVLLALQ